MFSRIEKMFTLEDGSILYEFNLNGYQGHYLMPASDMQFNLINYGFTAPALVVFPDRRVEMEQVWDYACEIKVKDVAKAQGTGLLIMNPKNGETWDNEDKDGYLAAVSNFGIAQRNFRDGLAIMEKPGCPDERSYAMLGSCVRMYVYAFGSGADYITANALKKISGNASLGDLGMADHTMTCCTLVNGKKIPEAEKNDIIVVSVGNSEEYNEVLKEKCGQVTVEEEFDAVRDFKQTIGKYRRWTGKIMYAYNYDAEGIVCRAESCMVNISDDNQMYAGRGGFGPKQHKVGYVIFYDQNADVKNGKLPLLFVFHGGGDSAIATASLAEWPEIGQRENFITVAVEMHLGVSAREVVEIIRHLNENYSIDNSRIYATGFSMGGIKSWDIYQECPKVFAAVAPMDAIQNPGMNCFFTKTADERVNKDTLLPVFYVGGASSPLCELPKHEERALNMLKYVAEVNKLKDRFDDTFANKDNWQDSLVCVTGQKHEVLHDEMFPDSEYHLHSYESEDGKVYTKILAITNHAHEIRPFTNNTAWEFLKQFRRNEKGEIEITE